MIGVENQNHKHFPARQALWLFLVLAPFDLSFLSSRCIGNESALLLRRERDGTLNSRKRQKSRPLVKFYFVLIGLLAFL